MVKSQGRFGKVTGGVYIMVTIRLSSRFHVSHGKSGGKIDGKRGINAASKSVYFVAKFE